MKHFIAALMLLSAMTTSFTYAQKNKASKSTPPAGGAPKGFTPPAKHEKAVVNYTVNWGPDLKLKGESPNKILLYKSGSFYAITDAARGLFGGGTSEYISKFNKNMELDLQKKLESEKSEKGMGKHEDVRLLEFNDAIWLVTRERNSHEKKIVYFIENIDLNTLECKNNKKKIYEVSYAENKHREDDWISVLTNKDKNVMLLYEQPRVEKEENVKVNVTAIGKDLTEIWHKEITMPLVVSKGQSFSFSKYIDDVPNLYLLSRVYNDDGKRRLKDVKDGQLNYDYHIYTIGKDIPTFVDFAFNLKDKAVSQVELDINKKGEIIACGFYSDILGNKDRASGAKGLFYTAIDPATKTIKSQSYKKFDNDVFTAGLSAKKAAKAEEKLEDGKEGETMGFHIDNLVPRTDGGSTMFIEQAYTYTVAVNNGKYTYYVTHYVYNNIMVTKINAAGEIEWTTVIPKRQHYVRYPLVGSYFMFNQGDDTYDFYFNDDKDNLNETYMETKGNDVSGDRLKNQRFVRMVLNPDGSLSKREIAFKMSEDDEDTRFYPTVSKIVSDNEVILYGMDRKKDKFAKITYKGLEKTN